jgi:hypothetical protein
VSWKPIDAFTIDAIVKKAGSVVNALWFPEIARH